MDQIGDKPEEVRENLEKQQARPGKKPPPRGAERRGEETADGEAAQEETDAPSQDRWPVPLRESCVTPASRGRRVDMSTVREQQPAAAPGHPALKKALTTPLLYFFILGDVLGAWVYVLVGQVAADAGGAVWAPLTVALLLAMLTAASYAELATKYQRAGGAAHYATRAFGPFAGFLAGFCMLAAGIVSVAALARGLRLATTCRPSSPCPSVSVAVVFLALLALLNARGIRESMRANVVATVVEVGGLLIVVALGAWLLMRGDGDPGRLTQLGTADKGAAAAAVLSGSVLAYYSFVGFETSVNVAEETRDPRRSYPRALFGALATAGAVYVLVGIAASAAVPTDRLAASSGPLLEVVKEAGGVPLLLQRHRARRRRQRRPAHRDHGLPARLRHGPRRARSPRPSPGCCPDAVRLGPPSPPPRCRP
ncbi:Putrescine transporter PotE [Streptomyces glaucescens]